MIANPEYCEIVTDMLQTLLAAVDELESLLAATQAEAFRRVAADMLDSLEAIRESAVPYTLTDGKIRLPDTCICAADSLKRILALYTEQPETAKYKLEFELYPILHLGYMQFRYWGCAWPDEEKIRGFREEEVINFVWNRSIQRAEAQGGYRYDLSLIVIAYNKLDYTQLCVESLLEHLPEGIRHELILYNHGSSDGTKAFFESVHPDKQIDISVNGAVPGMEMTMYEGKYAIIISNDTVITHHALDNLYRIVSGAPDIGWVVPATSAVSNNQMLPETAVYTNEEELQEFAVKNNIRDERREEQRVRLCNPITAYRTVTHARMCKDLFLELFCAENVNEFPDDKSCAWFRQNGYRLILAKDAYCHHFGSVTLKEEIRGGDYDAGRERFRQRYGYDPWGTGFCWHKGLIEKLDCRETGPVRIAAINCGLGSEPLKIKELLKENTGNRDVTICSWVKEPCYLKELTKTSDMTELFREEEELFTRMQDQVFHYILMEEGIAEFPSPEQTADRLLQRLAPGGTLCICFPQDTEGEMQALFAQRYAGSCVGEWVLIRNREGT